MKKAAQKAAGRANAARQMDAPTDGSLFLPPLKPRRTLFYTLLGMTAIWIGVLLALYFTTVYPRHSKDGTTAGQSSSRGEENLP